MREAPFEGLLFIGKFLPRSLGFSSPVISAEFAFKNAITSADFDSDLLLIIEN